MLSVTHLSSLVFRPRWTGAALAACAVSLTMPSAAFAQVATLEDALANGTVPSVSAPVDLVDTAEISPHARFRLAPPTPPRHEPLVLDQLVRAGPIGLSQALDGVRRDLKACTTARKDIAAFLQDTNAAPSFEAASFAPIQADPLHQGWVGAYQDCLDAVDTDAQTVRAAAEQRSREMMSTAAGATTMPLADSTSRLQAKAIRLTLAVKAEQRAEERLLSTYRGGTTLINTLPKDGAATQSRANRHMAGR